MLYRLAAKIRSLSGVQDEGTCLLAWSTRRLDHTTKARRQPGSVPKHGAVSQSSARAPPLGFHHHGGHTRSCRKQRERRNETESLYGGFYREGVSDTG